jgi:1-acyl-sn-glycerol-3-phosphate acyltransferase
MDVDAMTTNRCRKTLRLSSVPQTSPLIFRLFTGYVRHYLRRSFHAVRLLRAGTPPQATSLPLVIYCNHPSWWDPLVCIFLARHFFPAQTHYGPIDAQALARYRFFTRLGFFGVASGTRQGAATFLRVSRAILQQPGTVLWMTPEGQFTDPRQRPVRLRPGLGHLVRQMDRCVMVPLALEYPFWEEQFPEVLLSFGEPLVVNREHGYTAAEWTALLAQRLEATQNRLADATCRRDLKAFALLLRGRAGIGGVYDLWRAMQAWLGNEALHRAHGREEQ